MSVLSRYREVRVSWSSLLRVSCPFSNDTLVSNSYVTKHASCEWYTNLLCQRLEQHTAANWRCVFHASNKLRLRSSHRRPVTRILLYIKPLERYNLGSVSIVVFVVTCALRSTTDDLTSVSSVSIVVFVVTCGLRSTTDDLTSVSSVSIVVFGVTWWIESIELRSSSMVVVPVWRTYYIVLPILWPCDLNYT